MNQIMDMFKKFIDFILTSLKSLLTMIFGGFTETFKVEKKEDELVSKKLEPDTPKPEQVYHEDFSGYQSEAPASLKLTPEKTTFTISLEELQILIVDIFCEELELKKELLTEKEKTYIKDLQEKLIPDLHKEVQEKKLPNKEKLIEKVHEVIQEDLEAQIKLEQNFDASSEKIIISPLIYNRKPETITNSSNPNTFFKKKSDEVKNINPSLEIPSLTKAIADIPLVKELVSNFIPKKETHEETTEEVQTIQVSPSNLEQHVEAPTIQESLQEEVIESLDDDFLDIPQNTIINSAFQEEIVATTLSDIGELPSDTLEEVVPSTPEVLEELEQAPVFDTYDVIQLEDAIQSIRSRYMEEEKKELLEDKDYETIEAQIQKLLNEIEMLKLKNLNPELRKKLNLQEQQLVALRDKMVNQKQKDIDIENNLLNETILTDTLNILESELQKLHLEDKADLQKYFLNQLEDLNTLNPEKAKKIEKELLKEKLRKAIQAMEISSFLSFPFLRNKYLLFMAMGLFASRHLKLFNAVLNRKTISFEPEELNHITKGSHALEDALIISQQNIEYLNLLEAQAMEKYPDLILDNEYITYINHLKALFIENQEKLLRKKKVIQKYNIKTQKYIRKLKKTESEK